MSHNLAFPNYACQAVQENPSNHEFLSKLHFVSKIHKTTQQMSKWNIWWEIIGLMMFISKKKRQVVGKRCNNLRYSPTKTHSSASSTRPTAWQGVTCPPPASTGALVEQVPSPAWGQDPGNTVMEMSMPSPGAIPRHPQGPPNGKDSPAHPRDSSKHDSTEATSRVNVTWNNKRKSAKKPWIHLCSGHLCPWCRALCEERQGMPPPAGSKTTTTG